MNANMKVSEQCRIAASKGNQVSWNDSEKYNILDGYPASLGFPIMHRCSLFFICNNKVAMARARCGIGCEYTVYSGYLP